MKTPYVVGGAVVDVGLLAWLLWPKTAAASTPPSKSPPKSPPGPLGCPPGQKPGVIIGTCVPANAPPPSTNLYLTTSGGAYNADVGSTVSVVLPSYSPGGPGALFEPIVYSDDTLSGGAVTLMSGPTVTSTTTEFIYKVAAAGQSTITITSTINGTPGPVFTAAITAS